MLAFSVIATMLMVAGFPTFVVFFFGIFAYFLWKTFSSPSRNETREIFEFYLSANDFLRDDERRWYGFELQEVITRGERILKAMNGAPPLVYFALGALYNKAGDHKSAVNHLTYVLENENANESNYVYPSPELRNYVKVLRKIEREPAEAPLTSAAVRALERARRNRGKNLLETSREQLTEQARKKQELLLEQQTAKAEIAESAVNFSVVENVPTVEENRLPPTDKPRAEDAPSKEKAESFYLFDYQKENSQNGQNEKNETRSKNANNRKSEENENPFANRKPISEVLHDIYDKNVQ